MYGYNYNPYATGYTQPVTDDRIWVQNEYGAEAYLVAPNSFVRLWDANRQVFYEKRADASGRPLPIEAYEYKRLEAFTDKEGKCTNEAIKAELDGIKERLTALERGVDHVSESSTDNATV